MKPIVRRLAATTFLLAAFSAASAQDVEPAAPNADIVALTAERDAAIAETARLTAELARLREQVADLRSQVEDTPDERVEKLEKQVRKLESHREELKEWVEGALLPIAESSDPKLASLKKDAEEMGKEVERVRGLKFVKPLMRRLMKREDVGPAMRRDFEREMPREDAEKMVSVMAEFGVVSKDTDLYDIFSQFLEAGAAAYYKPDTETFYLIEGNEGAGSRPIVFHELVHALEDQHYGLDQMGEKFDEDSDAGLAFKGLVEGSADYFQDLYQAEHPDEVAAMMKDQMTPELMQKQMKMIREVPTFLVAMMGFYPYKNGSAFLRGVGVTGPEQMTAIWTDPPVSTEQVMHPAKYPMDGSNRDYPHKIAEFDLSAALGDGWEKTDSNSMGELMTGLTMVHMANPEPGQFQQRLLAVMDPVTQGVKFKPPVSRAVEGWDGDRYVAMHQGATKEVCIAWTSVWDSEKDAQEFAQEFGRLVALKVTGEKPLEVTLPARFAETNGQISGVTLSGAHVIVVLGAPADAADKVFAAAEAAEVTPDPRDANDAKK